jgi:uncharacterized protein (DUF2062 family)
VTRFRALSLLEDDMKKIVFLIALCICSMILGFIACGLIFYFVDRYMCAVK